MANLPPLTDMLRVAERPQRKLRPMAHQVTFPVHNDEQWSSLQKLLWKKQVTPKRVRFSRAGMEIGFETDEDAVLVKMAFNST